MTDVVICEPLRTPVGRFGGVLKDIAPEDPDTPSDQGEPVRTEPDPDGESGAGRVKEFA